MQIWDTAGMESFRSIIKTFYRSSAAVFLVYNIAKYIAVYQAYLLFKNYSIGTQKPLKIVRKKPFLHSSGLKKIDSFSRFSLMQAASLNR